MTDRILALLALVSLALFISVVPIFVPSPDLILLAIFCLLLAAFDFWRQLFRGNGKG